MFPTTNYIPTAFNMHRQHQLGIVRMYNVVILNHKTVFAQQGEVWTGVPSSCYQRFASLHKKTTLPFNVVQIIICMVQQCICIQYVKERHCALTQKLPFSAGFCCLPFAPQQNTTTFKWHPCNCVARVLTTCISFTAGTERHALPCRCIRPIPHIYLNWAF